MEHTVMAQAVHQYPLSKDLAKGILEIANQAPSSCWEKSGVGHNENPDQEIRTSKSLNFREIFPFWDDELRKQTVPAINHYATTYDCEVTQDEGFNLLRYSETKKYDFHADSSWSVYRTCSILVYLNPAEYEGGETFFKHFDLKVKPEEPCIVVFPANYAYLHAALPVTSGEKFVLVSWMNDMPRGFNPGVMHDMARITGRL